MDRRPSYGPSSVVQRNKIRPRSMCRTKGRFVVPPALPLSTHHYWGGGLSVRTVTGTARLSYGMSLSESEGEGDFAGWPAALHCTAAR